MEIEEEESEIHDKKEIPKENDVPIKKELEVENFDSSETESELNFFLG